MRQEAPIIQTAAKIKEAAERPLSPENFAHLRALLARLRTLVDEPYTEHTRAG